MSKVGESSPSQPTIPPDNNNPDKSQNDSSGRVSQVPDAAIEQALGEAGNELANEQTDVGLEQRQITISSPQEITDLKHSQQKKDQLDILEEEIRSATEKLARETRNSAEQCRQIELLINAYMDELDVIGDPHYAIGQLALFRDYLQKQLIAMSDAHKGFLRNNQNTNKQFLSKMPDKVNAKIVATIRNPNHIFENLEIPAEIESKMRTASDSSHKNDMATMKASWDKEGKLVIPHQISVDLVRNTISIHNDNDNDNDNDKVFDNSAHCAEYRQKLAHNETDAANEIRQAMESQIINSLDGLSVEAQMQILSHINQTELNHMLYCLQCTVVEMMPEWGLLAQQNPLLGIDVVRNQNSTNITYRMNSVPTLVGGAGSADGEFLHYDDQSRISLSRTATIDDDGNVDYGKIAVKVYLHAVQES